MLVLSREPGQEIVIGGNIRVTIVGSHNGKVRVGIDAPREVSVDRREIHDLKIREQRQQPTAA